MRAWLVLIVLSMIWGTSYILMKRGLVAFSPYQVACIRLSVSSIIFIPAFFYYIRKIDWTKFRYLLLVGVTGTAIPAFLFPIAQTQISSSLTGILNSLTPLSTLVLGVVLFKADLVWKKVVGVLVGLVGASILIFYGTQDGSTGNLWYGLLVILATICYGMSSNLVGYYLRDVSSLLISAISFTIVGLPAVFLLFSTDFVHVLAEHEAGWASFGYVVVLALFSTVLASVIYFRLIQWTTPLFASSISYLVPIVATLLGFWDGEVITLFHFTGMGLILLGVYLSRK